LRHFTISRHDSSRGGFLFCFGLPLFEGARLRVRFDRVARFIVKRESQVHVKG